MQLAFITFFLVILTISASDSRRRNGGIGGFYQIKITYPTFDAWELILLGSDNKAWIIDNTENSFSPGSGTEAQPFTDELGEWRSTGGNKISIHTGNYNEQNPGSAVLSTFSYNAYDLTLSKDGEKVCGTVKYDYYKLGDFPNCGNAQPIAGGSYGPYKVEGQKVKFF